MQSLIDEANQSLEESGTPLHDIMVIVLHQEFSAGTIGITLAGGRRLRVQGDHGNIISRYGVIL